VLTATVLLALVLAGCTDDGPRDPGGEAAKAFLSAWAGGDVARAASLTDDPTAATELLEETTGTLRVEKAAFEAGTTTGDTDDGPATVPFKASLTLDALGTWAYDGSLSVVRTGERWLVDWAPTVVHPRLSEATRLSRERDLLPRAPILDREGEPLMRPRAVVEVGIEPRRLTDPDRAYALARDVLEVDPAGLAARVEAAEPDHFVPVITLRAEEFEPLRRRVLAVDGYLQRRATRTLAPTPTFARGLLGTVPPATAETLAAAGPLASEVDAIGASGLQAAYEQQLAGEPSGAVRIVTRADRGVVETLHEFAGRRGTPLRTTLDTATQSAAEKALAGFDGNASLVAVQPSTGEVLAAANVPGNDASNRAFTGRYPPGSTFKVVTTAALLAGGLGIQDTVACPRTATVEGKAFENQNRFALGEVPFARDFAESCNTAFVTLAQDLSAEALAEQAPAFGLGADWDLGVEAFSGDVPTTPAAVDRAAASIGQGQVLASPLAMAGVAATVASGTTRPPVLLPEVAPAAGGGTALQPATAEALRTLMRSVVTEGSAEVLDLPGEPVAAKTGTAEYGDEVPPRTHAWVIGYRGDLAFEVILEDGGSGGRDAAPVARAFLEAL
jgi:cell division protein FtsI/penicillin-binding protein 2